MHIADENFSFNKNVNDLINENFSFEEVLQSIHKLANNKSAGQDDIFPEFMKNLPVVFVYLMKDFFNKILNTGTVPDEWAVSIICPIHKKGDTSDPNNYRGVSLINCICKIFTSLIGTRIRNHLDATGTIGNEQAGFRKGISCQDQIFLLSKIVAFYLTKRKRLYATFIDYEKAFDTIDRALLWKKLYAVDINGKILNVIRDIYQKTKAYIRFNMERSASFPCEIGVRQGDVLSPLLFQVFINDFETHMRFSSCNGLTTLKTFVNDNLGNDDIEIIFKLFVLLYADDTILLAESEKDMQKALEAASLYCSENNLKINCGKTKYMIFSRGKVRKAIPMFVNDSPIERVDSFCYLGVIFKYNNTFQLAIKHNIDKAKKALFKMLVETSDYHIAIETKLHMFDSMILPILTYGCEVWGYENLEQIEVYHRFFLKKLLSLRSSVPNAMIYGELGRHEIRFHIWSRMIMFWKRLVDNPNKYSSVLYYSFSASDLSDKWLGTIRHILIECGIPGAFEHISEIGYTHLKNSIKHKLEEIGTHYWRISMEKNDLCQGYKVYKHYLRMESYIRLLPYKNIVELSRFRCASMVSARTKNKFTSEYNNFCTLCETATLADEYHLLLVCSKLKEQRAKYLDEYFLNYPNILKFDQLMNQTCPLKLSKFATFCKTITDCYRCNQSL